MSLHSRFLKRSSCQLTRRGIGMGKLNYSPQVQARFMLVFSLYYCVLRAKGYEVIHRDNEFYGLPSEVDEFITPEGIGDWIKTLKLPHKVRDYQYKGIYEALRNKRKLLLSPTGSGKSLMIYALSRFWDRKRIYKHS